MDNTKPVNKNNFERMAKSAKRKIQLQRSILQKNEKLDIANLREREEDLNRRIRYIELLIDEYNYDAKLENPEVFISFTGEEGALLMNTLRSRINKLKVPGKAKTFKTRNGMTIDRNARVIDHIVDRIRSCSIFVGILTNDFKLQNFNNEENTYSPGSWVLIEAGIATALKIPVIFFIEDGIDRNFWDKHAGQNIHAMFSRDKKLDINKDKNFYPAMLSLDILIQQNFKELP